MSSFISPFFSILPMNQFLKAVLPTAASPTKVILQVAEVDMKILSKSAAG
ncbi:MAG: hypothetical protein ACXAEL_14320 [Candidatus Hodarchaeales archaeon]|jgi:hypothetical protein